MFHFKVDIHEYRLRKNSSLNVKVFKCRKSGFECTPKIKEFNLFGAHCYIMFNGFPHIWIRKRRSIKDSVTNMKENPLNWTSMIDMASCHNEENHNMVP